MKHDIEMKVLELIHQNNSFWTIKQYFKTRDVKIQNNQIVRIKKKYSFDKENQPPHPQQAPKRGPPFKLLPRQISNLKKSVSGENPKPNNQYADKYGVHESTIGRYIKRNLGLKRLKKVKVHVLSENEKLRRYQRSLELGRFIAKNLDKIITSDEKIFQLPPNCGQSEHFFEKSGQRRRSFFIRRQQSYPKQIMLWGGISMNGKTKLRFIKPGVKVNSDFYINHVLEPFISEDLPVLYPNNDGIFHRDSATSHTSKKTLKYLESMKINFIHPSIWTPKSPDNASMDFSIWGYMMKMLKKRNIKTLIGLKQALTQIWDDIPDHVIQKTLLSWPRRCKLIRKARGGNIEHLLREKKCSSFRN